MSADYYRDPLPPPEDVLDQVRKRMKWEREAIRAVNREEDEAKAKASDVPLLTPSAKRCIR